MVILPSTLTLVTLPLYYKYTESLVLFQLYQVLPPIPHQLQTPPASPPSSCPPSSYPPTIISSLPLAVQHQTTWIANSQTTHPEAVNSSLNRQRRRASCRILKMAQCSSPRSRAMRSQGMSQRQDRQCRYTLYLITKTALSSSPMSRTKTFRVASQRQDRQRRSTSVPERRKKPSNFPCPRVSTKWSVMTVDKLRFRLRESQHSTFERGPNGRWNIYGTVLGPLKQFRPTILVTMLRARLSIQQFNGKLIFLHHKRCISHCREAVTRTGVLSMPHMIGGACGLNTHGLAFCPTQTKVRVGKTRL